MIKKIVIITAILGYTVVIKVEAKDYFLASNGKDTNSGTVDKPFKTLKRALDVLKAGDILNIRGGTYPLGDVISISGEREHPIVIQGYRDEKVKFVGTYGDDKIYDVNQNNAKNSFTITGDWLILRNLDIGHGATGLLIKSNSSHNRFENLKLHDNYYSGLLMKDGAEYNTIINCDAYRNFDSNTNGQHADGFVVTGKSSDAKPFVGVGNEFINCRSWNNSDDGFDVWQAGNPISFINCLSYDNGKDIWHKGNFQGDGNGFKLGVHNRAGHPRDAHTVVGCKAWNNNGRGFDSNDNKVAITLYNNVSWKNKKAGYKFILTNHTLIDNIDMDSGRNYIDNYSFQLNNSWNRKGYNPKSDISSFDDTTIKGERDSNGHFISKGFLDRK